MFTALIVVTALLALICLNSAAMKLGRNEQVLATIHGTAGSPSCSPSWCSPCAC